MTALVGVLVATKGSASVAGAQAPTSTSQIDVVADDYAFMPLPARIKAGPTIFSFANRGKVVHEMSMGRLKPGTTVEDLVRVSKAGGRMRDIMDRSVGVLFAGPGKSPDGRLLVDLLPGETYVVLCNFKDTPDAPTHLTLGMYAVFRPE
jgi:plastocyanin